LRCPKFLKRISAKISTAATPYASLHLPPAALGNVPTSIRLRICQAFFKPCNLLSFFDACASRYILLRCPKFLKRISAKISTAATPYASLHLPPAALGNVPTSIRLRICRAFFKPCNLLSFLTLARPVISCCGARNF